MSLCFSFVAVTILVLSTSTWAKPLDRPHELGDNISSVCLPAVTSYITVSPSVIPTVTVITTLLPSSYATGSVSNETTKSWSNDVTSSAFPGTPGLNGGSAPISSTSLWNTSEPTWTAAGLSSLTSTAAGSLPTSSSTSSPTPPETIPDSSLPTATSSTSSRALTLNHTLATVGPVGASDTIPVTLSISEVTSRYTGLSWTALGNSSSSSGTSSRILTETLSPTESGSSPESITITASTSSPLVPSSKTSIEVGPTNALSTAPCPESETTGTSAPTSAVSSSTPYQTTTSTSSPESTHESRSLKSTPCTESDSSLTTAPASPQTTSLPPYPIDTVCPTPSVLYSTLTATTTIIKTITSTSYPSSWVTSRTDSRPSTTRAW